MNPTIQTHVSRLMIFVMLITSVNLLPAWAADSEEPPDDNGKQLTGSVGLQSLERVPMTEIFFQAKEGGSGGNSAKSRDAIVGAGFFQIQTPDGGLAYTRHGSFKVASDGRVVTEEGFQLLAGMPPISPGTIAVIFSARGQIFLITLSGSFASGRIHLVRFENPAALKPMGTDLFLESESSGPPETGNAGENGFGELGPGFLQIADSFGFTTQLGPARSSIDVEVSQDAKAWTVLASILSSNGEKLFVRDIRAGDFAHRFYRMRSRPLPPPPVNGQ